MSRPTRRPTSQQLEHRPSINILNFSSDVDTDFKRNSQWWKNLSDNSRHNSIIKNILTNPDSLKEPNSASIVTEGDNSQWWRNLSGNDDALLPYKVNKTGEIADKKNEDLQDNILSQSESEDDEVFLKKRLFASQGQRSKKSRYSRAFKLNTENINKEQEYEQKFKIEEFKNQLENDNKITESPTSKGSKKRRKTKSIFSKKLGKRKYSDAFTVTSHDSEETEQTNNHMQKQDSSEENISISKDLTVEKIKEGLFKLNPKKKKYSEAFLTAFNDETVNKSPEKEVDTNKSIERVRSSYTSIQKKKYSEPSAVIKSKDLANSELVDEIFIEEIHTQKNAWIVRNQSLQVSKGMKNIEETSQKEIPYTVEIDNTSRINLSKSKNKKLVSKRNKKYDSDSSDEVIIEEINTPNKGAETSNLGINITKEMKTNLFQRNTKGTKYSEAFLAFLSSKISHAEYNKSHSEQENDEHEVNETISPRKNAKKSLFTLENKKWQFSQAFTNIFEGNDENKENNQTDTVFVEENATKQTKESLDKLKNTNIKCSQAFLELISMQKLEEDKPSIATCTNYITDNNESVKEIADKELGGDNNTKFSSIASVDISYDIKHPLFGAKDRNKSVTKNNEHSNIQSDREPQNLEKSKTKKNIGLRSTSPTESGISIFFDESLISSTKICINSNEDKDAKPEKKKRGRPSKSMSQIRKNSFIPEIDTQISKDNKDTESEDAAKNKNSVLKRGRKSKSSLTTLSENPDVSDNQIQTTVENKDTGKNLNSTSKWSRKLKSIATVPENSTHVLSNKMQMIDDNDIVPENTIAKRGRKSKSVTIVSEEPQNNEPEDLKNNESKYEMIGDNIESISDLINNINSMPKRGRKSKSVTRVSEDSANNAFENKTKDSPEERIVKNKNATAKTGRKSKSLIRVFEDPANNSSEKEVIDDKDSPVKSISDELINNINSMPKRGRKSKSVTRVSEDSVNNAFENERKDSQDSPKKRIVQNKNATAKTGRKSKSVIRVSENPANNSPENETIDDQESPVEGIDTNKNAISKTDRKSKSVTRAYGELEDNTSVIQIKNDTDPEAKKNKNSTSNISRKSKLLTKVLEDQENNVPENKMMIVDENSESDEPVKYKNSTLKRGRKSKSVTLVYEDLGNNVPENKITGNDDNAESTDLVKHINSTPKRGRKFKAVKRVHEDLANNIPESKIIENNDNSESNDLVKIINPKPKTGRKSISVTKAAKDSENNAYENELTKDSESNSENLDNIDNKDRESEKSVKKKNSTINRTRKSSLRTDEYYGIEVEDYRAKEPEELVTNIHTRNRNSSIIVPENLVQHALKDDIFATEDKKMDNQRKQKKIVSNIPRNLKIVTNDFQKQDNSKPVNNTMSEEIIDINSDETEKRQILAINKTRKSSMDRKLESESISNIITIHSSLSRARSSQFSNVHKTTNKDVETWLSNSIINYAEPQQKDLIENRHSQALLSNLNLEPSVETIKGGWKRKIESENSETKEFKKNLLLKAAKNISQEKRKTSQAQVPVQKITDYFSKLNKDEKLKPIPKKTNIMKKVSKPVCTARLINGKPYYSKKLFCGKRWCTPQLYKLLQDKIRNEYGDDTINESEKLMKYIVHSVQLVIKSKKHLEEEIYNLKKELAKYRIIRTTYDFFCFCLDYLPAEYQNLAVPFTQAFTAETSVPYNQKDVLKPIEV